MENYFDNRKQRVILDGQCSSWKIIFSDVPQGSVLGPLLFLIYINNLANSLNSICKIFADDKSIFSKAFDKDKSQRDLNNNLSIINEWGFQWKMQFTPDSNKQANEDYYFFRKSNTDDYIPIKLNDSPVQMYESQKHFGIILDKHLNFYNISRGKVIFVTNSLALLNIYLFTFVRLHLMIIYLITQ